MNRFFIFLVLVSLVLLSSCKKEEPCTLKENDQTKIKNILGSWHITVDEEVWRLDTLYEKSGGEYFSVEFLDNKTGKLFSNNIDSMLPFTWVFQFDPDKLALDLLGNLSYYDFSFEIKENRIDYQQWEETKKSTYQFGPNTSDSRDVIRITWWELKR